MKACRESASFVKIPTDLFRWSAGPKDLLEVANLETITQRPTAGLGWAGVSVHIMTVFAISAFKAIFLSP